MLEWDKFRRFSRGYLVDPVVRIHPRIIVGSGEHLIPNKLNIKYVVNCAFDEHSPEFFRKTTPQNYYCIEAEDSADRDITSWYPKFEEVMNKFMNESSGQIFVHCQLGINRSAFLALMYVCIKFNYDLKTSVNEMCRIRPCMFSNKIYREQVIKYIEKHNGRSWK